MSVAAVMYPPFFAVAAMDLESIRATALICPSPGLEPSLLGKFLVVWRSERPLLAGTSPAPKHGPQNDGLITAPASSRASVLPERVRARLVGTLVGYTESEKYPFPVLPPARISAASTMLSKIPPEQPAMIP